MAVGGKRPISSKRINSKGEVSVWYRDPRRPRSWLRPYILFFMDVQPEIVGRHPEWSVVKVGKAAGKLWRGLPQNLREDYFEKAAKGKRRYEKTMSRYKKPSQEELRCMYGARPKRFLTSYIFFVKRNFEKVMRRHPSYDFVHISRHLAGKWRHMDAHDKDPYEHLFLRDWRRWNHEMHLYRSGHFRHSSMRCRGCCQGVAKRIRATKRDIVLHPSTRSRTKVRRDCEVCLHKDTD